VVHQISGDYPTHGYSNFKQLSLGKKNQMEISLKLVVIHDYAKGCDTGVIHNMNQHLQ